jgi:hypothetical protein
MSSKYQVIKVTSLPGSPQANSVYYVKASGDAEVKAYISDSGGTAFPLGTPNLRTESINVTLSTLNTDVNVKVFNTTDKTNFIATALPVGNIDGFSYGVFFKGYNGSSSVFRRGSPNSSNISLNVDGLNGNTLIVQASGSNMANQNIIVKIVYIQE